MFQNYSQIHRPNSDGSNTPFSDLTFGYLATENKTSVIFFQKHVDHPSKFDLCLPSLGWVGLRPTPHYIPCRTMSLSCTMQSKACGHRPPRWPASLPKTRKNFSTPPQPQPCKCNKQSYAPTKCCKTSNISTHSGANSSNNARKTHDTTTSAWPPTATTKTNGAPSWCFSAAHPTNCCASASQPTCSACKTCTTAPRHATNCAQWPTILSRAHPESSHDTPAPTTTS